MREKIACAKAPWILGCRAGVLMMLTINIGLFAFKRPHIGKNISL